jgi:hypothetical protein
MGHTVKTSASKPSIANISIVLTEAISGFGLRDFGVRDIGTSDFGLRTSDFDFDFGFSGFRDFGFSGFFLSKVSEKKVQFFRDFSVEKSHFAISYSITDMLLISRQLLAGGNGRGEGARRRGLRERIGERGPLGSRGQFSGLEVSGQG